MKKVKFLKINRSKAYWAYDQEGQECANFLFFTFALRKSPENVKIGHELVQVRGYDVVYREAKRKAEGLTSKPNTSYASRATNNSSKRLRIKKLLN